MWFSVVYLANRFHVALRLFSNRSQMTSKCGKKKSGTRAVAECVTDVVTTFWRLLWSITESDARQHEVYLFYIITKSLLYFKIFQHNAKAGLLPRRPALARKKAIWRDLSDLWSVQNEAISLVAIRSKELWLVEKNRATVKPDASVVPRERKLTAKQNWTAKSTNLEAGKCWKNQVSLCHRSGPVSRKAWTLPWKLQELKKYPWKTCGYGQPGGHLIRLLNERSINDGGDFCLLVLVILKSAWYSVGDTF